MMTQMTDRLIARWRSLSLSCVAIVGLLAVTGCAEIVRNHGYTPTDLELEEVIVGVNTREVVEEAVGRPATSGVLRDGAWYYVGSKIRHFGGRKPKEVERQVVAISFGDNGIVSNVERFGLDRGQVVTLSRRVTETSVPNSTFVRQVLRHFGRFDVGQALGG
jgi:outer membrane protein assembly factor BamE (lipoprotein component of BamABCDE complex)